MKYKMENNYLDITNYPIVEKHFEDMATKGWLISKIIPGSIFIYKKIEPQELDFSISPCEDKESFIRKTKKEIGESKNSSEFEGWTYATKSKYFHIYFKNKNSEVKEIQKDEEEEFKILEIIGNRLIKSLYILIPLFLFISWTNLVGFFFDIYYIKDGLSQIVTFAIPIALIFHIMNLINIKRFLKTNKKNIEMDKSIEYNDSKLFIKRLASYLAYIYLFIFIIYILYAIIFLRNRGLLMVFIPSIVVVPIAAIYSILGKSSKKTSRNKVMFFTLTIISSLLITNWLFMFGMDFLSPNKNNQSKMIYEKGYKVLSFNDFQNTDLKDEGDFREYSSIPIPKSYDYYSFSGGSVLVTEYSKALTEGIASNLVSRYKKQAEKRLTNIYSNDLEFSFKEGVYNELFLWAGLTIQDFNDLKGGNIKNAEKAALNIIKENSVMEDKDNLWNVDEAYFLNYGKTEIVLRIGKEVFYLDANDFSDSEVIRIVKDKLGLK